MFYVFFNFTHHLIKRRLKLMWFYPDKFIILFEWGNITSSIQELKYAQARQQLWFHSRHSRLPGRSSRFIEDTVVSINWEDYKLGRQNTFSSLSPPKNLWGKESQDWRFSIFQSAYISARVYISIYLLLFPRGVFFAHDFQCLYEANSPTCGNQMVSSWFFSPLWFHKSLNLKQYNLYLNL